MDSPVALRFMSKKKVGGIFSPEFFSSDDSRQMADVEKMFA
jgi:hypothetical protein